MQLNSILKAGVVAAALAFSAQAGAVPLNGSVAVSGVANETGADLLSRTSFTISGAQVAASAGSFNGPVANGTALTINPFDTAPPAFTAQSVTFGQFGTFTSTSFTEVVRTADFLNGIFTGTFTPDVPGVLDGFEGGPATFRVSLTRSTFAGGASVSFSGTLALPPEGTPTDVPEPASMALLGAGLLGLGLARRRKTN